MYGPGRCLLAGEPEAVRPGIYRQFSFRPT